MQERCTFVSSTTTEKLYLSHRSRGLRITEAYTLGLLKNEDYMRLGPPLILSVPNAVIDYMCLIQDAFPGILF